MRDAHRLKEKVELDGRQTGTIAVVAVLALGAAFAGGIWVGQRMAREPERPQVDPLSVLDAKAESPRLTFHDELTRARPDAATAGVAQQAPSPQAEPGTAAVAAQPVATRNLGDAGGRPAAQVIPREAFEGGAFSLQLAATQDRGEADQFVSRLRARGYAPYVVEADVADRGTWYRVRMGGFRTREAANRYLADFRRETGLEAFVAQNESSR